MGAALIKRGSHGVELTRQGALLLERGRELLAMEAQVKQELRTAGSDAPRIQLVCRCIERFLPDILIQYRSRCPGVCFSILQNDDIALQNHQYDLVISGLLSDEAGYRRDRLLTERILCALPREHPLASGDSLSKRDFSALPQIQFGGHRQVQWLIRDQLRGSGLELRAQMICDDVRMGCTLVTAGFGALLIPEYAFDEQLFPKIKLLPLEGAALSRDVYLYRRTNSHLLEQIQSFSAFLLRYCGEREGRKGG